MAKAWLYVGLAVLAGPPIRAGAAAGPEQAVLRESARPGQATRVVVEMKAEGHYVPEAEPAQAKNSDRAKEKALTPKRQALKVQTKLDFIERVERIDPEGRPRRVARKVATAEATIGNFRDLAQGLTTRLRPEVALLIAERREGMPMVFSPVGPLTRSELEIVQAPGDPLALAALLPGKAVAEGDRWTVGVEAARMLTDYDALAANGLESELEALEPAIARFRLQGEIGGAARGGEGTMKFAGRFTLDRKAGRIDFLEVNRSEIRKPGPVEAGLDVRSTLVVRREAAETPSELSDAALSALSSASDAARELLLWTSPGGKFSLVHDRDWHVFYDDVQRAVFKRLDHGELIAQCNLVTGPNAGKGRHQDLGQFRDDIRRALGGRFERFLDEQELEGVPPGELKHRVAAFGRQGEQGVIWYYYLLANRDGDQLLATVTLGQADEKRFGGQDLQLIGSLEWKAPVAAPRPE